MTQSLIELRNVKHYYNGRLVLNVPYLDIFSNKITILLGPNASGKSTLLRLINMLEQPGEGNIYFKDVDIIRLSREKRLELQRQMVMVFQRPVLLNTTLFENVAFGLHLRGMDSKIIEEKVEEVLKFMKLDHLADRSATRLSGGEVQLAAIARGLAVNPELLILDEPMNNLDPRHVKLLEQTVLDISRERDMSIIIVTHQIPQVSRMADEVVLLEEGEVIESGPAEEIFNNPQKEFTREFIGGII